MSERARRGGALPRGDGGVRGALELRDARVYDRYGHAGLRSGGFQPTNFDIGNLSDLFSAFFGDDLFGGGRGRGAAPTSARRSRSSSSRRHAATKVEVPFEIAVACGTCGGDGVEPGTETPRCTRCDGTGRLQQVTRSLLGQFVRTHACPQCAGRGVIIEHPCHTCTGAGVVVEERQIEVDVPAGIHDGQRIRLSGEGHAGEPAAAPATSTCSCA